MQSQAPIRPRSGWQPTETERLFSAVDQANAQGVPLRSVFEQLAAELGRKPNSIRNYYYTCLRQQPQLTPRSPAFRPFTPEETRQLLRKVLIARGCGQSVRACVLEMAEGSQSRMLRYQNKYRTILKHRPELIAQVAEELRQEGLPCPAAPSPQASSPADSAFCDPDDAAAARLLAQPCVHHMLEGMKELLRRASRAEAAEELQRAIDRQQVQHDLQRIAWAQDYDACTDCLRRTADALAALLHAPEDEARRQTAREALDMASSLTGQAH